MLQAWEKKGRKECMINFSNATPQKWRKKLFEGSDVWKVNEAFKDKYATRNLLAFNTQKSLYICSLAPATQV
jgi:hypothetical protein